MKNEKSKPRRNLNEILVYGDLVSVFPDTLKGSETRGSDPHAVANWRRKSGSSTSGIWDSHTFHKTSPLSMFFVLMVFWYHGIWASQRSKLQETRENTPADSGKALEESSLPPSGISRFHNFQFFYEFHQKWISFKNGPNLRIVCWNFIFENLTTNPKWKTGCHVPVKSQGLATNQSPGFGRRFRRLMSPTLRGQISELRRS